MNNQDAKNPDCNLWSIKPADGKYTIQISESCQIQTKAADDEAGTEAEYEAPYADNKYFAWVSGGTVVMGNVAADNAEYEKVGIYWKFLTNDQYNAIYKEYKAAYTEYEGTLKVYEARVELDKTMTEAEAAKLSTAEAEAVYNNPDASVEQLNKANETLKQAIQDNQINLATPENPYDVTSMSVKNPNFDENGNNWNGVGDKSKAFQYQGSSYTNEIENEDGTTTTITIKGFMEHWVAYGTYLNDAVISQELTGIRSGKYVLQADCEAFMQSAPNEGVPSEAGCFLFANGGGDEIRTQVSTQVKKPQTFRVEFTVYDDEATIGFRTEGADCNATAIDNVKLFYCGPAAGAELEQLDGVINKMGVYQDNSDEETGYYYSEATHEAYIKLMTEANAARTGSTAAMKEMIAKLAELEQLIKDEIAAYKRLSTLINEVTAELENDDLCAIGNLGEIIGDLESELDEAYNSRTYSIEQIEAAIAKHSTMIRDEVTRILNSDNGPGTEITALLVNPGFNIDGDKSGWEGTALGNVRAGAAEQYNKTFDTYQILKDIPNGKYKVEVTGFHRYGTTTDAANAENEDELVTAELYGNDSSVKLHGITAGAQDQQIYTDDKELGEGSGRYVPFSMEGFAEYVKVVDGAWTVNCEAMVTDGTLKIGVRVKTNPLNNSWVIFDNFRVTYVGNDVSDYADAIQAAAEDLQTALENYADKEMALPAETTGNAEALIIEAGDFSGNSVPECEAMIKKLRDAITHLDEVYSDIELFVNTYAYYETARATYYDDAVFAFTDELYDKSIEGGWETEAELTGDIASMHNEWRAYVLEAEGVASATIAEPAELTPLMRNPSFEWNNGASDEFWTIENRYANPSNGITEFWGKEKWSISQSVEGLPAGYYDLTVQACYRSHQELQDVVQDRLDGKEDQDVVLFANTGSAELTTPIMSILDGGDLSLELGGTRNATVPAGETLVTNGGAYTYTGGTVLHSPTGMELTSAYFNYDPEDTGLSNQGFWKGNKVSFRLNEGETVTLGIKKYGNSNLGGNWVPMDNFQLFYLGTTAPDAVKGTAATASVIKSQAYYTIGGMRLSRPQRGVNIIVTTWTDGHTTTQKAVVK